MKEKESTRVGTQSATQKRISEPHTRRDDGGYWSASHFKKGDLNLPLVKISTVNNRALVQENMAT